MKTRIDGTAFGSITVEGTTFEHDVIVRPDGKVKRRKKKLSKAVYGTSHIVSLDEAEHVCRQGAGASPLIVGSGQYGRLQLSPEAADFFERKKCPVVLLPTPEAVELWNTTEVGGVGLFHVTC